MYDKRSDGLVNKLSFSFGRCSSRCSARAFSFIILQLMTTSEQ